MFTTIKSHVVYLPVADIDTDQIIPARFLKVVDKLGLARNLFHDWRYLPDGSDNPDFVLNAAASQGSNILLAGDNFGCGSSREHAPWALVGWGFRAVISTSFADIFRNNSLKNGLLPIVVSPELHAHASRLVQQGGPSVQFEVNLQTETLTLSDGTEARFQVDPFSRRCLMNGVDELGYLLSLSPHIDAWEAQHA